ncbi:hypothetical protein FV228_00145 [Methylobacterium sp. WL18]|uniref:hypothetical protein n=1 Tax=Methylobacterium sp. WL18 TaxID=2603897 RepID=UPI0011CADD66|nr:hypothetical protein [Methylobacterium sp. WL18]TXN76599.1 hypothetical protein FV228_00145 [Methylobacterium sp. WL18]
MWIPIAVSAFIFFSASIADNLTLSTQDFVHVCDAHEVYNEVGRKCAVGGMAIAHKISTEYIAPLKPVSLKCPAENGGVIEMYKLNADGDMYRMRAIFRGSEVDYVVLDVEDAGGSSRKTAKGVPNSGASDQYDIFIYYASKQAIELKVRICESLDPNMRARYNRILNSNRLEIKNYREKFSDE